MAKIHTCVNGKLVPKDEATISPYDHGYLYGDGTFEGIRIYNGRIFKFKDHMDRLYDSLKVLRIEIAISREELEADIIKTIQKNELYDKGYIRLVISRGIGDLGINPRKCTHDPTVVIIVDSIQLYPEEMYETGIDVITCSTRRMVSQSLNPRIKSLNYLCNIFGIFEANKQNAQEGIMLTIDGYVSEATVDNLFLKKNGQIWTPPLYLGILEGITRNTVMDLAVEKGYKMEEKTFTIFDVYTADEVWLTGSGAELIPIKDVDGLIIGEGKAGPVFKELRAAFQELTRTTGFEIPRK
ncbi:branched-chain-amino-acid transaminase [bacterium]|nr:branched-chain-amino-acid transaminase [bacterium]